jgi:hypothetical protein
MRVTTNPKLETVGSHIQVLSDLDLMQKPRTKLETSKEAFWSDTARSLQYL